ncbi:hypothetical protein [Pedobacter endophyticus]|uniref:Uncharacterized protein n=1 Tax=Pedobacter endophyticus TaxID=2789740 RepID=A0A7S9KZ03_9SPHI|nr:hypothetical protein [Pedobacter endophyticus]QPH39474.1 hypothetical protein IZT61_20930 [Pedobacter endophyticus]
MAIYRLNLNQQANGDYEVHEAGCVFFLAQNYDDLGSFSSCEPAVNKAKKEHPYKKINGCNTCSNLCHTT